MIRSPIPGVAVVVWSVACLGLLSVAAAGGGVPAEVDTARATFVDRQIASLRARLEVVPRGETWIALGDLLMERGRVTGRERDVSAAETAYRHALRLTPHHPGASLGIARVHDHRHDFARSVPWARRAIRIDPRLAAAHGLLGDAALEQGSLVEALAHYQAMLDLRPDVSSYARAARWLRRTGEDQEAAEFLRKAIRSGIPDSEAVAWCRAELALVHLDGGDPDEAESVLRPARVRFPDSPHVRLAAAQLDLARGGKAPGRSFPPENHSHPHPHPGSP